MTPVIGWFVTSLWLGLLSFPIAFKFFPKLADRGYSMAKALGILLNSYIFWLLACGQILPNSTSGVLTATIILAFISYLCLKSVGWREFLAWCKSNISLLITCELVFLISFLALVFLRSMNPEIANTEKPMELAFINSILRSPSFPPADPWLSGYSISYYYFGYVMISALIRLTVVSSGIGYNLASATWFGLTALGAFGILFNIVFRSKKSRGKPLLAGLLGPLFLLIVSNLEGLLEVLHARRLFWKADSTGAWVSKFWTWLDIMDLNQAPAHPASWIPQRWMWWWRASRVVTQYDLFGNHKEVIDEFPFFSYLLSDLHPHVLAMPFVLLAIGFAVQSFFYWVDDGSRSFSLKAWMKQPSFWLCSLIFGSLGFLNTWDLPFYLAFISFLFALARYSENGKFWAGARDFVRFFLLILGTGIVLFSPFYVSFQSQAGGILPSLEFFTRGVHFWVMFGALLVPICCWLVWKIWKNRGRISLKNGVFFTAGVLLVLFGTSWSLGWLLSSSRQWSEKLLASSSQLINRIGLKMQASGLTFSAIHGNVDKNTLLLESFTARFRSPGTWLVIGAIVFGAWSLLSGTKSEGKNQDPLSEKIIQPDSAERKPIKGLIPVMILFGAALSLAPEFVYLQDQFGWPINTYFKFYFAAWIFWGLSAAYCFWSLINLARKGWRIAGVTLSILFVLGGLVYPILGSYSKSNGFHIEDLTLDGLAFRDQYFPEEEVGIEWLRNAPYGYVVEAIGGQYSEYARIATETGLPNVLGWPGHVNQWRGGVEEMGSREADVRLLYESSNWDEAASVLDRYLVRYVIVGSLEKSRYPGLEEEKFTNHLRIAFQNPSLTIYEYSGAWND